MNPPRILDDPATLYAWATEQRDAGRRIVLVPTMGALHAGHLSLVREAKRHGDIILVSIFVNPAQFGADEDLDAYPRPLAADIEALAALEVDAVFTPTPNTIYPDGFDTYVTPESMATVLCGASRPDHFRGVCTVVLLLFRMSRCHAAVFGEKDYQQLQILKRMSADLWLDVEVIGAPTVREADGLAMSSRNVYLSAAQRQEALVLSRALDRVAAAVDAGERGVAELLNIARTVVANTAGARLDYVDIVDAESLQPLTHIERSAVCALAVVVGDTRLIDNRRLSITSR